MHRFFRETPKRRKVLVIALVLTVAVATAAYAANFFDPTGTHDLANCSQLAGWAKDGDTTAALWVDIYKGAPAGSGGTFVTRTLANLYRSDLPFADKNHGFVIATPSAFKTGYLERVYIHAINADTNGNPIWFGANNPLLNSTGKYLYCLP